MEMDEEEHTLHTPHILYNLKEVFTYDMPECKLSNIFEFF